MEIKIFVAAHKRYDFPDCDIYTPIQVGCSLQEEDYGYERDNSIADNISSKNRSFCELTALYSMWKNGKYSNLKYIGLSHYRRYFIGKNCRFKKQKVLNRAQALMLLEQYDIIVPKKRNYYIESVYNHYCNAHYKKDIDILRELVAKNNPKYLTAFDKIMEGKKLHLYNMFVMKKSHFDDYCAWLFDILFKLEQKLDISHYDAYQGRVFGFLSERLWNVWLEHQKLSKVELRVANIEGENYLLKAYGLLKRKFLKKDY